MCELTVQNDVCAVFSHKLKGERFSVLTISQRSLDHYCLLFVGKKKEEALAEPQKRIVWLSLLTRLELALLWNPALSV